MAQHDYVIANGTGAAVRSDLNNALAAIVSQNSGATEPATTYAYQWWADTTTNLLKLRNSANSGWITLFQLDGEWSTIALENGTAGAPSLYFKDSGTDTGFYSPGTDQVGISTGGTARLTIDANGNVNIDSNTLYVDAANNRVGLGTSSPQQLLHLSNTSQLRFPVSSTANAISFWKDGTPSFAAEVGCGSATGIASALKFDIYNGSSWNTAVNIDSSSRVGIGTTSPGGQLDVSGTSDTRVITRESGNSVRTDLMSQTAQGGVGTTSNHPFFIQTNGSERCRVDTSGRLLVGTSTSRGAWYNTGSGEDATLQVEGGGGNAVSLTRNVNSASGAYLNFGKSRGTTNGSNTVVQSGDILGTIDFQGADGSEMVEAALIKAEVDGTPGSNDMPGRLVFSTTKDGASSPTEAMRIDNAGNLLLQKTSAAISGAGTYFEVPTTTSTMPVYLHFCKTYSGTRDAISFNHNGSRVGSITFTDSATAFNTSSDYRLKENVVPLIGATDRLKQLLVHRFNFIVDPNKTVDGFIAHEVQAVVPECVSGEKDEVNEDGSIKPQGIDQSKLVPLLTAALQEAIGRIETLEAEVAALKGA